MEESYVYGGFIEYREERRSVASVLHEKQQRRSQARTTKSTTYLVDDNRVAST